VSTTTETVTTAKDITTVDLAYGAGKITVVAEATDTPGLAITPECCGGQMTGNWQITHTASGLSVPIGEWGGVDIHCARRIAAALATTPVDWAADLDAVRAQLDDETVAVVKQAVRAGKYPPSDEDWDGAGNKPVAGPGGWPNTAAQATATQLAGAFTQSALQRYADTWTLVKYDRADETAERAFVQNTSAMIGEFGAVSLLRTLGGLDQAAADAAARDLWEACEAGDSFGEWLAEWGREYGIPIPEAQEFPGLTPSPALEYDAVLRTPAGEGTIGSLRESIARTAHLGEEWFRGLASGGKRNDRDESLIAHGCSFHGWALVALLGWLAKEYPQIAIHAARMVDDIGWNGGNDHCNDVPYPPASKNTDQPATAGNN
jgi:hypothetical protein